MTDSTLRFPRTLGLGLAIGLAMLPATGLSGSLGDPPAPSTSAEAAAQPEPQGCADAMAAWNEKPSK
jgi:hypothetical protein